MADIQNNEYLEYGTHEESELANPSLQLSY